MDVNKNDKLIKYFVDSVIKPQNSRTTVYITPIEVVAESITSEIFTNPPDQYEGTYIKISGSNDFAYVRIHSEYQLSSAQNNEYAIILFECAFDAPERRVWKGKRKYFAVPYPDARAIIEMIKTGSGESLPIRLKM